MYYMYINNIIIFIINNFNVTDFVIDIKICEFQFRCVFLNI